MSIFTGIIASMASVFKRSPRNDTNTAKHISLSPSPRFESSDDAASCSTFTAPTVTTPPTTYSSVLHHQDDLITEFFGGRPRAPNPPPISLLSFSPIKGHTEKSQSYPADEEPATLAKYMFLYGFFFPPFWLMGIFILCTPLRATPEWEMGKTSEEATRLLQEMRSAEIKWAKRCLWAVFALLLAIGLVVMGVLIAKLR